MANNEGSSPDAIEASVRDKAAITTAMRQAKSRLRFHNALRAMVASLWMPVLAAAVWLLFVRFTLLDLPRWPVLVFFVVWLLCFFIWLARLRITPASCAHYLDSTLGLDERITTYLELEARAKLGQLGAVTTIFRTMLASDTAMVLNLQAQSLPRLSLSRPRTSHIAALSLSLAFLVGAAVIPTRFDETKQEHNVVREALDVEAQKLADLRAEIVARPDLPEAFKQDIVSELDLLQHQLLAENTDREEALATIGDAEEKIRQFAPGAPADFEPVTRAADLLQDAASEVTSQINEATGEESDLSSAEASIRSLKPALDNLTNLQARALASDLERAASAAASTNPEIAQNLQDAADAIRKADWESASAALDKAAQNFHEAVAQQQSAEAVESTLAKLEDGRESIAKAGVSTAKRGQVGFRRPDAGQPGAPTGDTEQGNPVVSTPSAGQDDNQTGQRIGQNQPFSQLGNGSSGQSSSQQGGGSGQSDQSQGDQSGQAGGRSSTEGGSDAGSSIPGSNLGRVNGPVRVTSGSQSGVGGAEGNGVGAPGGQNGQSGSQGDSGTERIYVPDQNGSAVVGRAGQAAPEQGSASQASRAGEGPDGETVPSSSGLGAITTINTPYTEVLGEYSEQAIAALDKAYVPPDAKQYVRDYFTALGK